MKKNLLQTILDENIKLTPMFTQFVEVKNKYPDTFLFFRMGDFYELFFDDAIKVSELLGITLTHRGSLGPYTIPMAGIPFHSASNYIDRLTEQGFKVSICEQLEDPKKVKGLVKRGVVQTVGPGIPFDLDRIDKQESNYIAAGCIENNQFYWVFIDFTHGDFWGTQTGYPQEFLNILHRNGPKEILTFFGQWDQYPLIKDFFSSRQLITGHLSQEYFNPRFQQVYLEKLIPYYQKDQILANHKAILGPIAALAYYIFSTQLIDKVFHLKPFRMQSSQEKMQIGPQTLVGLNILPSLNLGSKQPSLLSFLDKTQTAFGSRNLKKLLLAPHTDLKAIAKTHQAIDCLTKDIALLDLIRKHLSQVKDLETILAKLSLNKLNPSNILALKMSLDAFLKIDSLKLKSAQFFADLLDENQALSNQEISQAKSLFTSIHKTISEDIRATLEKGNLILASVDAERDKLWDLTNNSLEYLKKLEEKYKKKTGITNLKIKHNNIFGYFIDVTKSHLSKVPDSFIRKQTLTNCERYITTELIQFEKDMSFNQEQLLIKDQQIFGELIAKIQKSCPLLQKIISYLNEIDLKQTFAYLALSENWACPQIDANKKRFEVEGAFHPLLKSNLKDNFVPHNLNLNEDCFFALITGPNMAGKTTVMREVAIIQILAQMGSYVPAQKAKLGICDFLFSRLGASDDIIGGQSTFMVEMAETAEIIRHATNRSLILLDEVGRGTSTYDGLSIAWALCEHLIQKTQALCLFATHYHELMRLVSQYPNAKNLSTKTSSLKGKIIFHYSLLEKGSDQSFGIYVAQMAGLPSSLLNRSKQLLQEFESDKKDPEKVVLAQEEVVAPSYIEEQIDSIDILNLSPMQAFDFLKQLKLERLTHSSLN